LQSSVAVHLLEIDATERQEEGVRVSTDEMVTLASQTSEAEIEPVAETEVETPH
jgi:hypothetical protein